LQADVLDRRYCRFFVGSGSRLGITLLRFAQNCSVVPYGKFPLMDIPNAVDLGICPVFSLCLRNDGLFDAHRFIIARPRYTPLDVKHPLQQSTFTKGYAMAILGYARVSTIEQTLDLQRDALLAAGTTNIYEDKASGKTADRPELAHCLKALRDGDTLVVWRLDRLGRNLQDLVHIVNDLEGRGVKFKSLKESVDTGGPAGRLVFHLFAALAQFERELLRERTLAGLAAARARGRKGGRPSVLDSKQQRAAVAMMRDREMSITEIARQFGVSRSTLYNLQAASKRQVQ
jgi:DNA invertase Pin-like site-specific DNA recombinase